MLTISCYVTNTANNYTSQKLFLLLEMIWFFYIFALGITFCNAADHEIFKNCSRVPFCSRLRYLPVQYGSLFGANLSAVEVVNDTAYVPLNNSAGTQLILEFWFSANNIVRTKIKEKNSSRYELTEVLDQEPIKLPFYTFRQNNSMTFKPYSNMGAQYQIKLNAGPPLTIEYYFDRIEPVNLALVLRGDYLVMENTNTSEAFAFAVEFNGVNNLYGLHHHAVDLELPSTENTDPFRLRNSDTSAYEVGSPMALYGSVPVIYGHAEYQTTGIFLHNAAEQWVNVSYAYQDRPSTYFMVESGTLDLFVLLGPNTISIVRQYTSLTGKAHLPQLWTLGYHQSRWSYLSQSDVKDVVANMHRYDFPVDAIWLDIDYTDGKRYFTWNPENFSDPVEMQKNLSSTNTKLVTILDPHIKVDPNYPVYSGAKGKYFVKWANGSDFEGECWPGISSYIDFMDPEARDYYASWYSYDKFNKSTEVLAGVWNDMNEPSVFDDSLEKTFPFELVHHGNVLHRDVHNIYGFLQTKATHQGLMQRDNGTKRPFILTRSHFSGSQRYAATWTGDNTADWPYLRVSYSECILSNLLGHVFCGADIGGFSGNPDEELLQRWYQAAVWMPFFRGHSEETADRREPYLLSDGAQQVVRNAIKLRYKHIPYFYTRFYEHTGLGDPVIRPLFYEYPGLVNHSGHALIGKDILAVPVLEQGLNSVNVTLPQISGLSSVWFRADDNSWMTYSGNQTVEIQANISTSPFFYRGGSVIPRWDNVKRNTAEMQNGPFTLHVNYDMQSIPSGFLYVDDYTSFDYLDNKFAYLYITVGVIEGLFDFELAGGDPTGFDISVENVIVHQISTNLGHSEEIVYTSAADGTPLKDINIAELLNSRNTKGQIRLKL